MGKPSCGAEPRIELGPALQLQSDEEMERDLGDERRTNVLYECDEMNVCTVYRKNMKNKTKRVESCHQTFKGSN